MNKIFKVVWSKVKHCYIVVSEVAKSSGKTGTKSVHTSLAKGLAMGIMLTVATTGGVVSAAEYTEPPEYDHGTGLQPLKSATGIGSSVINEYAGKSIEIMESINVDQWNIMLTGVNCCYMRVSLTDVDQSVEEIFIDFVN